ncbi:Asp-tRNA(Asn)/Glu-tRNA(Gln) amidotransferase subunit GatC [archaeon]|nr:Asp-tRNA(Asn)/Glu-tRNA(Gln) amidotransferase subunit GatC [archaeon]
MEKNIVDKIAKIAKIDLTTNEKKKFEKDITNILDSFSKLDEIDVKNIEPTFNPLKSKNLPREDKIEPCLTQKEALANTKLQQKGYFKGPKAI